MFKVFSSRLLALIVALCGVVKSGDFIVPNEARYKPPSYSSVENCLNFEKWKETYSDNEDLIKAITSAPDKNNIVKEESSSIFKRVFFSKGFKVPLDHEKPDIVTGEKIKERIDDEALVREITVSERPEFEKVAAEIKSLFEVKETSTAPKYLSCFYRYEIIEKENVLRFYIIQEKIIQTLGDPKAIEDLKKQKFSKRVDYYYRLALVISTLHLKKVTHQKINANNIVFMNDGIFSYSSYIDFNHSVKLSSQGTGARDFYSSPDKYGKKFTASAYQDAYALALTILALEDTNNNLFQNTYNKECISKIEDEETFAKGCKESISKALETLGEESLLKKLYTSFEDELFEKSLFTPLTIKSKLKDVEKVVKEEEKKKGTIEDNAQGNSLFKIVI